MKNDKIQQAAEIFTGLSSVTQIEPFGKGRIHQTYLVKTGKPQHDIILQKVNRDIFKDENVLLQNYQVIKPYLKNLIPDQLTDKNNQFYFYSEDDCWRAFKYIPDTISLNHTDSEDLVYQVSSVIGKLIRSLRDLHPEELQDPIPDFHNLSFRYARFESLLGTNSQRLKNAEHDIKTINEFSQFVDQFRDLKNKVPLRIVHNDAKLDNVLLDQSGEKAIAIVDLDTVMSGHVWNDFGDMVRTFVPSIDEDSGDFKNMKLNKDIFRSLASGFLSEIKSSLARKEIDSLFDGALFITFEQALRYLTDYLEDDIYYPVEYPEQNLLRAGNQLTLLKLLKDDEEEFREMMRDL